MIGHMINFESVYMWIWVDDHMTHLNLNIDYNWHLNMGEEENISKSCTAVWLYFEGCTICSKDKQYHEWSVFTSHYLVW